MSNLNIGEHITNKLLTDFKSYQSREIVLLWHALIPNVADFVGGSVSLSIDGSILMSADTGAPTDQGRMQEGSARLPAVPKPTARSSARCWPCSKRGRVDGDAP
jgi:hypothetical protein